MLIAEGNRAEGSPCGTLVGRVEEFQMLIFQGARCDENATVGEDNGSCFVYVAFADGCPATPGQPSISADIEITFVNIGRIPSVNTRA